MQDFGTKSRPLRASSLYRILQCPARTVLQSLELIEDSSGTAADTGSMVHAAVENWHRTKSTEKALKALAASAKKFPKGDVGEAEKHFRPYTLDPRNKSAEVVKAEVQVEFTLPQDIDDPYGPIYVRGHLDQLRRQNGRLYLWDLKTGSRLSGWEMLQVATLQLAAYVMGASQELGQPVYPGGIIASYGYRRRGAAKPETEPAGVFFSCSWDLEHAAEILRPLSRRVYDIRRGIYDSIPGEHCSGCPAGDIVGCRTKLREVCGG